MFFLYFVCEKGVSQCSLKKSDLQAWLLICKSLLFISLPPTSNFYFATILKLSVCLGSSLSYLIPISRAIVDTAAVAT